jgi:phage repressor protein C with HTH and peptisase S24 domain
VQSSSAIRSSSIIAKNSKTYFVGSTSLLTQKDKNLVKPPQIGQALGCIVLKWELLSRNLMTSLMKKYIGNSASHRYNALMNSDASHNTAGLTSSNPIGQRLKLEMKKRGLTSAELAKMADVKTSFLYDIMSGKSSNPSTVKLARVADSLDISLTYLVGNQDTPSKQKSSSPPSDDDCVAVPRITVDITADGSRVTSQEYETEVYFFRRSWITERLGISVTDLRLMYVRGDNMEPTLCHNDIVLIDTTKKTPSPPGIFVCFDGLGLTARRLEYVIGDQSIRLLSDNPQYSTFERPAADTLIIGRVVWFAREI